MFANNFFSINKLAQAVRNPYVNRRSTAITNQSSAFRYVSLDNVYSDSNPAVSPKSNVNADSMAVVKPHKLETDCSSIKWLFYNDHFTTTSDAGLGNTLTIQSAVVEYKGVTKPISFGTGSSVTLADQQINLHSLELLPSLWGESVFEEGQYVTYKGLHYVPSLGNNFVVQNSPIDVYKDGSGVALGQCFMYNRSTVTLSDINTAGKFTVTSGSVASNISGSTFCPLLVGVPVNQKRASVFWLVDSIGTRFLSEKYLREQFPESCYPMMKCAVPGISLQKYLEYSAHWTWLLDFADDFCVLLGTNDFGGGATGTVLQGRFNSLFSLVNTTKPSITKHVGELFANTSDPAGTYLTLEAQSYKSSWVDEPALRSTYFPSLVTAGTIAGVISSSPCRASTDDQKWPLPRVANVANYWCDSAGVHLSDNGNNGLVGIKNSGVGIYNGESQVPYWRLVSYNRYGIDKPTKATITSATAGNTQVVVNWSAPDYGGGSTYTFTLQYKLTSSSIWISVTGIASNVLTYTVTGLTNGSSYDFRVLVVNSYASSTSAQTSAAPNGVSYDAALSAIFDVSANVSKTSTNVYQWQDFRGNNINFKQAVPVAINSLSGSGTVVTVSATAHGMVTGMNITVTGAATAGYNVTANITVTDANTFTYSNSTTGSGTGASYTINNYPTQTSNGDGIHTGNNQWLNSDTAVHPGLFDIVFEKDALINETSTSANILWFNGGALAVGASTGTFTNELIVFSFGTYKAAILLADYTTATGRTNIPTGKHVLSVRYTSGNLAQIWLDGVSLPVTENGSRTQTITNVAPTIGGSNTGAGDSFATYYELRHYSAVPTGTGEVSAIQATLKTKYSIA